jgi:hypothetical protein
VALWQDQAADIVTGTPFRVFVVVIAVALAWRLRKRMDAATLLGAVGAVFLLRLLVEPVIFAHYLAPAVSFLVLHRYADRGTVAVPTALAIIASALFLWHPASWIWWGVFGAVCLALAAPAITTLFGPGISTSGSTPEGGALAVRGPLSRRSESP